MSFKNRYKYNVVNDDLDTAVNEVLDILEKRVNNRFFGKYIMIMIGD